MSTILFTETRATMNRRMLGGLMRQQKNVTLTMAELVENAMNLQVRRVRDVMTPIEKVGNLAPLISICSFTTLGERDFQK